MSAIAIAYANAQTNLANAFLKAKELLDEEYRKQSDLLHQTFLREMTAPPIPEPEQTPKVQTAPPIPEPEQEPTPQVQTAPIIPEPKPKPKKSLSSSWHDAIRASHTAPLIPEPEPTLKVQTAPSFPEPEPTPKVQTADQDQEIRDLRFKYLPEGRQDDKLRIAFANIDERDRRIKCGMRDYGYLGQMYKNTSLYKPVLDGYGYSIKDVFPTVYSLSQYLTVDEMKFVFKYTGFNELNWSEVKPRLKVHRLDYTKYC